MSHSELPPSSADKWFHCHGWRRLNADIPNRSSAAADEGSLAHEWLANYLEGKADLADCEDPEMTDHLFMVAEWVQSVAGDRYVEHRVDYGAPFGFVDLTGTSDLVFVTPGKITIADLKYGKHAVEAKDNLQMLCYLVGAVHAFGRRPTYSMCIAQPRSWHRDGPIRAVEITDDELRKFEAKLEVAIRGSYKNDAPATPGDWCRNYCDALGRCKAVAQQSINRFREEAP